MVCRCSDRASRSPRSRESAANPRCARRALPATDPLTARKAGEVTWYGQCTATIEVVTATALWPTDGSAPLPLRWVLVRKTCRAIERRAPRTPRLGDPAGVEYAPVGRAPPLPARAVQSRDFARARPVSGGSPQSASGLGSQDRAHLHRCACSRAPALVGQPESATPGIHSYSGQFLGIAA